MVLGQRWVGCSSQRFGEFSSGTIGGEVFSRRVTEVGENKKKKKTTIF